MRKCSGVCRRWPLDSVISAFFFSAGVCSLFSQVEDFCIIRFRWSAGGVLRPGKSGVQGHKKRENDLKTAEKYRKNSGKISKKQRKNMGEMEFVEIPNVDNIWV